MEGAVSTDLGGTVNSDRTTMSDIHAGANFGILMEINQSHD
jgi:hypothetical protein